MILACEICARDEQLRFRYATEDLYREHLELVHGIRLDEDGRSIKDSPPSQDLTPEPSIIVPRPRHP